MSVVVVGLNHRHATLDQLERLSVSREQLSKALLSLVQRQHVGEADRALDAEVLRDARAAQVALHEHLDGGVRPATIVEIADETGKALDFVQVPVAKLELKH